MNREVLEEKLLLLPLHGYFFIDPKALEFSQRVRVVCQQDCPMYGRTWACPPGVGPVEECSRKCLGYENCLVIGTAAQVADISDIRETLDTRPDHEKITNQVRDILRELGQEPYVLSAQACDLCSRCAYLDGLPCRLPGKMHPCVESHGINLIPTLEDLGLEFRDGDNVVTWYSLLFY